jgi:predicted MFS family arabinose efflux permease
LGVYAFGKGGTTAVGLTALIQAIPAAIAAPVLGVAGDRYPRQRVLLVTNALRACLLGGVAWAVLDGLPIVVILAIAAVFSMVSTANQPARAALIPALSRSPREVSSATSMMGVVDTASFLLGAGCGAILLASTSVAFVVALCAASYAAATVMMVRIPVDARPRRSRHERPGVALRAGLDAVLGDRRLRLVIGLMVTLSIVDGLVGVFVIVTPIQLLGLGTAGVGYLNIARGAGGLLGGAAAFSLLGRARLTVALGAGALTLGLPLCVLGVFPRVGLALLAWSAFGFGFVLVKVSGITLVQRLSGDRVLARVLAVLETSFVASIGVGAILAPALESPFGLQGALILTGLILPAASALRWSAIRRLEREFKLLRECPVFAPLPLATVEGLAARLTPIDVPTRRNVVTQGEEGERFYLIVAGAVEVIQDGVLRRRQGPGDSFGEIALLHNVTRTATVRTVEATQLLALDREPFLVSVTGYADSQEAAFEVADKFLRSIDTANAFGSSVPADPAADEVPRASPPTNSPP